MRGVYPTLSHSILLLLGLIAMSLIITSISLSLSITEKGLITTELNFFADSLKDKIIEIYSLTNQSSDYTTGFFQLDFPEKIGNRKYSITFNQDSLFINMSVRNEQIVVNRKLAINAELSGTSFMPAYVKVDKINDEIKIGLIG